MEVRIILDAAAEEPYIELHTAEVTPEITALVNRLANEAPTRMLGFKNDEVVPLTPAQLIRVYTEDGRVMAKTDLGTLALRYRLYELDTLLADPSFLRISNSEIINFKKVRSMNMSISGTITVTLSNGTKDFVSRRYVARIKDFLGL